MKALVILSAALAMLAAGMTLGPGDGLAAKKKKAYTAEERKKLQAEAWKICRKKPYHVVQAEVNWQTLKVTCWYR
jgi:hypothetical protein